MCVCRPGGRLRDGVSSTSSSSFSDSLTNALFMNITGRVESNPIVPDWHQAIGQWRQRTQVDPAFGGAVKIGPARCQKAVVPRDIGVLAILRGIMAACHNFYALSSQLAKFVEERVVQELRIGIPYRSSDNAPSVRIHTPPVGNGNT